MKNADMPAAPLTGDAYTDFASAVNDGASYNQMCQGLTKREHFAAMAMQGMLGSNEIIQRLGAAGNENMVGSESLLAAASVNLADALLAELERTQ